MAVDNMAVRMQIAEACESTTIRFIDCRMAAMMFEIHMFIPVFEMELYKKTWYTDEEASPVTCTNKSVSFNCLAIAAVITRIVKGIIKEEKEILNRSNWQIDLHNLLI
jgi:molybdopterin/thiamine biosynthesis adenylyltransferase